MSRAFPELDVLDVVVEPETRERHLATISAALQRPRRHPGRRRLLAIALAVILLFPVVALAAESALPGDILYPFKRTVVEPVVSVFDEDAAAVNRVEEVEELLANEAAQDVIRDHVVVARDAAVDSPELMERIDRILDEVDRRAVERPKETDEAGRPDGSDESLPRDLQPSITTIPSTDTTSLD